jgi:hypothetical protein
LPKRYLVIRQADLRRHPASQRQMSLTDEIRPSRREVPRKNCGRSSGPTKSDLLHFPALLLGISIEIALIEIAFERIRKPDLHRGRHIALEICESTAIRAPRPQAMSRRAHRRLCPVHIAHFRSPCRVLTSTRDQRKHPISEKSDVLWLVNHDGRTILQYPIALLLLMVFRRWGWRRQSCQPGNEQSPTVEMAAVSVCAPHRLTAREDRKSTVRNLRSFQTASFTVMGRSVRRSERTVF